MLSALLARRDGRIPATAWWLALVVLVAVGSRGAGGADANLVLDEAGCWRQYYRFGANRISPAALQAEGAQVLGAQGLDRLKKQTQKAMQDAGLDPAAQDWMAHAAPKLYLGRYTAPPPPDNWAAADFDDSGWVRQRGPFQGGAAPDSRDFVDRALVTAFHRARFVVDDPAKAGDLTLRLTYHGGARVLINGTEVARGHLPAGPLVADAPAQDYPAAAYRQPPVAAPFQRALGPVTIPARLLVKGANVLAVEVHASPFHPVVMTWKVQQNWQDLLRPSPHAHLAKLELRAAMPGGFWPQQRPAGAQVWVADPHHRTVSTEFLPPGESAGIVRFVGARNGAYGAQLVIGTDEDLRQVRVVPAALRQVGGAGEIAAANVRVFFTAPYPANEFTIEGAWRGGSALGSEKGTDGKFPTNAELARLEAMGDPAKPCVFDHLAAAPPERIPGGRCWPVWLSLAVPADAPAGSYRGTVRVSADGMAPTDIPMEAEIAGWRLPAAKDFQTVVACEENPYGVAKQYGAPLWSDAHFKLLEASFAQLARVGNRWLNVPIIRNTEFGNRDDSMVPWVRQKDGATSFDFAVLDRYLDLAVKHWGRAPFVNFIVMHGTKAQPPTPPEVVMLDEATGRKQAVPMLASAPDKQQMWTAFAAALAQHMDGRGFKGLWYWGFPADGPEEDPKLLPLLAQAAPGVFWGRCSHCLLPNFAPDPKYYRAIATPRYWGNMQGFRNDMGWKSPTLHLLMPRVDSTVIAIQTASQPFVFRLTPELAVARGRNGIARMAADGWAGAYFDGMAPRVWVTGLPVLHMLWPGRDGAEPGIRFEAMLEGIQETEARTFLEKALDRNLLPADVAGRVKGVLAARTREVNILQPNIDVQELEGYYYRWQERSAELYRAAGEVSSLLKKDSL